MCGEALLKKCEANYLPGRQLAMHNHGAAILPSLQKKTSNTLNFICRNLKYCPSLPRKTKEMAYFYQLLTRYQVGNQQYINMEQPRCLHYEKSQQYPELHMQKPEIWSKPSKENKRNSILQLGMLNIRLQCFSLGSPSEEGPNQTRNDKPSQCTFCVE